MCLFVSFPVAGVCVCVCVCVCACMCVCTGVLNMQAHIVAVMGLSDMYIVKWDDGWLTRP